MKHKTKWQEIMKKLKNTQNLDLDFILYMNFYLDIEKYAITSHTSFSISNQLPSLALSPVPHLIQD